MAVAVWELAVGAWELTSRRRREIAFVAALLITLYGGLLRFEAVVANYGWMGQPGWSLALERHVVPIECE